ncbi:NAD(P)-dependent oxidoreductase [Streptomyces noursei]|uniref:NAD(P)-dependent oxidoreductase n=1 Tax=Streptomyces noursei TaxID=1971 RepID=UPI00382BCB4A
MADVTLIGTGYMGTALAKAMIKRGLKVNVWNRTQSKIAEFADSGHAVDSLEEAVRSAPVLILCLSDYPTTRQVLSTVTDSLDGTVLVQTAAGTPDEARELQQWIAEKNPDARYLECNLLCYPHHIGTELSAVLWSGTPQDRAATEEISKAWGNNHDYLGTDIAAANAYETSLLALYYATMRGAIEAAYMARAESLPLAAFSQAAIRSIPTLADALERALTSMAARDYDTNDTTLDTHLAAIEGVTRAARAAGLANPSTSPLAEYLKRRIAKGHTDDDIMSAVEEL